MKNIKLDKIDWAFCKFLLIIILAFASTWAYENIYTYDYSPRKAELTQLYEELNLLPGTTFLKKNASGKDGNVYIDYYFSSELSREEVLNHYKKELTNKDWEFRRLSTRKEPHRGEWIIVNEARYVREKNVKENGHYEVIVQYTEYPIYPGYPEYPDMLILNFKFRKYVVPWLR